MNRRTTGKSFKTHFFAVAAAAMAFLALGVLYAQDPPEGAKPKSIDNGLPTFPLFGSDALEKGDFNKLVEEAALFIGTHPDSPQAELVMHFIGDYGSDATNADETFEPLFERVLDKGLENGFNEEMYSRKLAHCYRKRGLREKADATHNYEHGYCYKCLVIGPFGKSYRASIAETYEPERDLIDNDVTDKLAGKEYVGTDEFRKIRWKKYEYEKPVQSPSVSPLSMMHSSGGCAYALIQVKSLRARPVLLDLAAGSVFKVWLNRSIVLDVDGYRKRQPNSHLIAINLQEGLNHILVKVPGSSFTLALRDLNGKLLKDLEFEEQEVIHPVKKASSPRHDGDFNGGAFMYYSRLADENPAKPLVRAAHAYMLSQYGMPIEALEEGQAALEMMPDNAFLAYYVSTLYQSAPHYPQTMARNKAKEIWDSIIERKPDFILAYRKIAQYLERDNKHKEAVKELRKVQEKGLSELSIHKHLYGIFREKNWEREKISEVKAIEKLDPDGEWVFDFWAGYYSEHNNPEKAWDYATRAYELDKSSDWYLMRKAQRLLARGKPEEAMEIYTLLAEHEPESAYIKRSIARVYHITGKIEEAIAQYKELLKDDPEDASGYEKIGDLYRECGKKDEAIEWYRKSLVLNPGNWQLRRYIQFLLGEDENFARPYAHTEDEVMQLVKSAPGREAYPKATNLIVLDETVTRMMPDGSQSSYVHRIFKILDLVGKERHSSEYLGEEPLEVRIILPDGKILEPTLVHGSVTMPNLVEGACIEYWNRSDRGWGSTRSRAEFEGERYFFQDPGLDEPILKLRHVLIVEDKPTDEETVKFLGQFGQQPWSFLDFCDLKQILLKEKGVKFSRTKKTGETVFVWEAEKMPRIEYERYMPPRDEILPNAQFISHREWSDFDETLKEQTGFGPEILPTELIRRQAAEITKGIEGQYEKVETLYKWCMKEIKSGWGGHAHAVLLEKQGDRETLFLAFLNALGISFDKVLIAPDPHREPEIDWHIPRSSHFSGSLVRVKPADHEPVYISMDTRYLKLGKIPEHYQNGIIYTRDGGMQKEPMPRELLDASADKEVFDVSLGDLSCKGRLEYPGAYDYGQKETYKNLPLEERKRRVENSINDFFTNPVLEEHKFPGLEEVGRMFEIRFKCKVPDFLGEEKEDGTITVKSGISPLDLQNRYADKSEREFDVVLRGTHLSRTEVTVALGDALELVQLPPSVNIRNEFGTYALTFVQKDQKITIKRRFNLLPQRIEKDKYHDFIEFCGKVDEAELARIIVKKAEAKPEPEEQKKEQGAVKQTGGEAGGK